MSPNTYTGSGWLVSRNGTAVSVTLTLSNRGVRWDGTAQPSGADAVLPGWLVQGLVVTVRLSSGGMSEARIGPVSLDRRRPLSLTGTSSWPG